MIEKNASIKLERLSAHIFLLPLPTNIGIVAFENADETRVFLIDSGSDDLAALKILESLEENFKNPRVIAIVNTHSHSDHCGGNSLIFQKTGCEIWASRGEAYFMEYPEIETALIWGGTPVHDIRSKVLLAKPCRASRILEDGEEIALDGGVFLKAVSLPGHYHAPLGFIVNDCDGMSAFFLGDAVSGRNVIKRYWIQYLLDETKTKESLRKIQKIESGVYVPGHGDFVSEIEGLAELNLIAILETEDMILDEIKSPKTAEEVLRAVAVRNGIRLGLSQFVLIGSTIRSYLAGLYEEGRAVFEMKDSRMFWKIKEN